MEATEPPSTVLQFYDELLKTDPTNAVSSFVRWRLVQKKLTRNQAIWKRRISVLRRTGKIQEAVEELTQFLDTFYTDLEGWLELADIYASCNQYVPVLPPPTNKSETL